MKWASPHIQGERIFIFFFFFWTLFLWWGKKKGARFLTTHFVCGSVAKRGAFFAALCQVQERKKEKIVCTIWITLLGLKRERKVFKSEREREDEKLFSLSLFSWFLWERETRKTFFSEKRKKPSYLQIYGWRLVPLFFFTLRFCSGMAHIFLAHSNERTKAWT